MFHVKHSPIEESPPPSRSLLDEPVHAWINDLDRQQLGDRRYARFLPARDPHAHAGVAELCAGYDASTIKV
jgi:hypothetical protein